MKIEDLISLYRDYQRYPFHDDLTCLSEFVDWLETPRGRAAIAEAEGS